MIGVSETVQKFLIDYIRKRVKIGDKLPSEREIARMLKVGRPSVREALQSLNERGIIEKKPGKGNYLKGDITGHIDQDLRSLLPTFDMNSSLELIEFRRAIETENAYLTAQRRTDETIIILEGAVEALRKCVQNGTSIIVPDMLFHDTIAHGTKNQFIIQIYDSLVALFKKVRIEMAIEDNIENALHYHSGMLQAIKDQDAERSRMLMKCHIEDLQLHYKKMLSDFTSETSDM